MQRFPTKKHYVVTPGSASGGSGSPGGGANAIQTNNGAGGFSGVGELTASQLTIPSGNGSGGTGLKLSNGANDYSGEYLANPTSGYTGGSITTNVLDTANLLNNSALWIEAFVQLVKTSGTPGNEGLVFRVKAAFRKDNTGTVVQIGASVYDAGETFNDTGDSLVGSPSLAVSAGSIALTFNLTTVETFRVARWVKFRAVKS